MKKLLLIALMLAALVFSVVACTEDEPNEPSKDTNPTTTAAATDPADPDESDPSGETDPAGTPADTGDPSGETDPTDTSDQTPDDPGNDDPGSDDDDPNTPPAGGNTDNTPPDDPGQTTPTPQIDYKSSVDYVNGKGPGGAANYSGRGTAWPNPIDIIDFGADGHTVDSKVMQVTVGGWFAVNGGVEKYAWSADEGTTWNEITKGFSDGAHLETHFGNMSVSNGTKNAAMSGIAADVSAYENSTISIIVCRCSRVFAHHLSALHTGEQHCRS